MVGKDAPFEILTTTGKGAGRTCYGCKTVYPDVIRFCPRDGVDLEYAPPPIDALGQDLARPKKRIGWCVLAAFLAAALSVFLLSDRFAPFSGGTASVGELLLSTTPSGATVYLDGSHVGVTPLHLSNIPAGVHEVRAVFPGFQNGKAQIEILPSVKQRVVLGLAPLRVFPWNSYVTGFSPPPQRNLPNSL